MTKTQIVNLALLRIGQNKPLTNVDTANTEVSKAALLLWDVEREKLLRTFKWSFAKTYADLELVAGAADDPYNQDYVFAYAEPDDSVFARRVLKDEGREDDSPPPFERGRHDTGESGEDPIRIILTNQEDAVLEYTANIEDAEEFDPDFASLLAWKLGEGLSMGHARLKDAKEFCQQGYATELQVAISRGLQEGEYSVATGQADFRVRELFNLAITRIGIARNAAAADPELQFAQLWPRVKYSEERDYVLRAFHWPFATAYSKALGLIDGNRVTAQRASRANDEWLYAYRLPSDCIDARRITMPGSRRSADPPPFDVGRGYRWDNDDDTNTLTLTTGAGWTVDDELTVTADLETFAASDVGNFIELVVDDESVVIEITEFVSATEVLGFPTTDVPAALQDPNLTIWSLVYDGALLYTDWKDAKIAYTRRVEDTAAFDALFRSALAWRLAALLAPSIAKTKNDPKVVQRAEGMFLVDLGRAAAIAADESQKDAPRDAEWTQARGASHHRRQHGMTFDEWNQR